MIGALCHRMDDALNAGEVDSVMSWGFPIIKRKKKKKRTTQATTQNFSVVCRGSCQAISKSDLRDLLGTNDFQVIERGVNL